jgi:signal transduction histidine kinase/DNA-binding NarL/FixJ family response regulator
MDIKLAGEMDGITAAWHISSVADVPIIFLTGFSQDPLLQRAKITAPYGYLIKPASQRDLAAAIEMALYKHTLDRQLRESEGELRAIYDSAPLILMLLDGERRVRKVNGFTVRFADRSTDAMIGLYSGEALRCFHALDVQGCGFGLHCKECAVRLTVLDTLETGLSHHQVEGRLPLSIEGEEKELVFLLSTSRLYIREQPMVLVSIQDITRRKRAEEEKVRLEARLLQSQKMESIGSLAGGIAHDLNNILFPISGLSEMLLDDSSLKTPERESIEQIYKSAQRGGELVKQILTFSRQSNPMKLPIRIQPILKEALKLARATIPRKIEITNQIEADCSMILADPTQVHQIAMNLITNACHAVEGNGGTIHISLKKTVDGYACICVSDTGTGIDQTLINKIFDPYFTTKEIGKGTGLGLSVVHGIVKEHGGDIRVHSEVGKGTTFNVFLPLLDDPKNGKDATIARQYPMGCERILLVDDEEPIVLLEQMMLERLGYQVTFRTSSPDALAVFKANPGNFDLVISDRGMPLMTGEQLARELILIKPGIPIIICTGFSDENDEQRCKALGVKGFLMKPVAAGDLATMVRKVLDD